MRRCLSYKWLNVIAAFFCYFIADGCTFSTGIFYAEFAEIFQKSMAITATLPGLLFGVPLLTGPLICPFVDTVGSSIAAAIGSCLLFLSFFISSFLSTLTGISLCIGLLASLGLELIYVAGIMAVSTNFTRRLGLATGLAVAGSGVGVFCFNPLMAHLMQRYFWRGGMLIESAILLNGLVPAALFYLTERRRRERERDKDKKVKKEEIRANGSGGAKTDEKKKQRQRALSVELDVMPTNGDLRLSTEEIDEKVSSSPSSPKKVIKLHRTFSTSEGNLLEPLLEVASTNATILRNNARSLEDELDSASTVPNGNNNISSIKPRRPTSHFVASLHNSSSLPYVNRVGRSSSAGSGAVAGTKQPSHRLPLDLVQTGIVQRLSGRAGWAVDEGPAMELGQGKGNPKTLSLRRVPPTDVPPLVSIKDEEKNEKAEGDNESDATETKETTQLTVASDVRKPHKTSDQWLRTFSLKLRESLLGMFSRDVWSTWPFLVFCLANICLTYALLVPWAFTYHRAVLALIPPTKAAFLISIIGMSSVVGQVICGFIIDYLNPCIVYLTTVVVMGFSILGQVWVTASYPGMGFLCALFGFTSSATYGLYSVILIRMLGVDRLYAGLGIFLFLLGTVNLIAAPISGFVYDKTGSYDSAYLSAAILTFIAAALLLPITVLDYSREQRNKKLAKQIANQAV